MMIDIHSHIIPGVDDGPENMKDALNMLRTAEKSGTNAIIATPHYFPGRFETPFDKAVELSENLKAEALANGINIDIYPGQEIFLTREVVEFYRKGIVKGLNGTRYILVETDMGRYSESFLDIIYELKLMGAVPVIAHPERYGYVLEDISAINPFIDEGCLFQINSSSITGIFGKKVQKTAHTLIKHGICNFIASDAHTNNKRTTDLSEALMTAEKIDSFAVAEAKANSERLLKNETIRPDSVKINARKSIFGFIG